MMKEVLLTGGIGFIGRHVLAELLKEDVTIYVLVRPGKGIPEYARNEAVQPIFVDLEDVEEVAKQVRQRHFDTVFHIGAIRGGRHFSREIYKRVNVEATICLAQLAIEKAAKFIFCSSVGVFGAIPKELPPTEATERQQDNYYHYTKILAEETLLNLRDYGLALVIIRPSIAYGCDDFGFPYALIKMVDTGVFLNCSGSVTINMVDVRTLSQAFLRAAQFPLTNGAAYNICDKHPVELKTLVNFIARQLFQHDYPALKTLPTFAFRLGEFFFGNILNNELWKARFQLISRSWYYNPQPAIDDLQIDPPETIPNFQFVIDWYRDYSANRS